MDVNAFEALEEECFLESAALDVEPAALLQLKLVREQEQIVGESRHLHAPRLGG